jgi:hypothetical protein
MPLFPLTCRLPFPVTSRLQASQEVRGERSKYERSAGKVFTFSARLAFWRVRRQQRYRPKCDQSEPVLKVSILPAACEEVETALGPAEVPPDLKLTCVDRKLQTPQHGPVRRDAKSALCAICCDLAVRGSHRPAFSGQIEVSDLCRDNLLSLDLRELLTYMPLFHFDVTVASPRIASVRTCPE